MMHVAIVRPADAPEIAALDRLSYAGCREGPPYTAVRLEHLLRSGATARAVYLGRRLVGYEVHRVTEAEIDLLRLAVTPLARRRGVGRRLIEQPLAQVLSGAYREINTEVAEGNLSAQLFLRACDFRAVEIMRGQRQDRYRFRFRLPGDRPIVSARAA